MQDIHNVISSFADPNGVVVVAVGKPPLIKGRPGVSTVTLTALANVGHVPSKGGMSTKRGATDAFLGSAERRTFYLQDNVLPVVVDPAGGAAWWIVANGKRYLVESVEPWTDGGFWVAEAVVLEQDRAMVPVWFGDMEDFPFDPTIPQAYSPSRSFRFVAEEEVEDLFVAWLASADGPSGLPSFKAINELGATVDVEAEEVLTLVVDDVLITRAILPVIASADGSLRYEVI